MLTSDGAAVLRGFFSWIGTVLSYRLPGLSITLWQLTAAMIAIAFFLRLALRIVNGASIGGSEYRGSSYYGQGEDVYKHWNVDDTDWNSDW